MPHSALHHSTLQNGTHSSKIPSSLRSLSRRASQFLRRDRSRDGQEDVPLNDEEGRKHVSFDYGCLPPLPLIRKRSKKTQAPARYSIAPDSLLRNPAPQLPEIRDLGKGRVVKKAKSLAIIPCTGQRAAQNLADDVVLAFRDPRSLDLDRDIFTMPGAFPKSSSPIRDELSSNFLVSPLPSPLKLWLTSEKKLNASPDTVVLVEPGSLTISSGYSVSLIPSPVKAWLTYDKKLNDSTDTIIRCRPDSHQSTSGLLQNSAGLPRSETEGSIWTSTTEPDTEPGTPLIRQETQHQDTGKAQADVVLPEANQQHGIMPSASTTSSVRDLIPHKYLRHQPKLPSERPWISIDTESHTTEKEKAEQAALRRKFHLPSSTSRSKLQWGDLESNVSSLDSVDAREMRKDLRLPSRRVSTPNLSGLRRAQDYVEGLSEQPEQGNYDPFFDSSKIAEEVFDRSHQSEKQANAVFYQSSLHTDQHIPHKAIINNLYEAVKRVDVEMARVHLENRQLIHTEEQANARAAFWEERAGGLEATMRERQKEKEELLEMVMERGVPIPDRLLKRWEETASADVSAEASEDAGYEGDVSGTTQVQ